VFSVVDEANKNRQHDLRNITCISILETSLNIAVRQHTDRFWFHASLVACSSLVTVSMMMLRPAWNRASEANCAKLPRWLTSLV